MHHLVQTQRSGGGRDWTPPSPERETGVGRGTTLDQLRSKGLAGFMEGRPETDHANQQIFRLSGTAVPTFCWACSGFAVCNQEAAFLFLHSFVGEARVFPSSAYSPACESGPWGIQRLVSCCAQMSDQCVFRERFYPFHGRELGGLFCRGPNPRGPRCGIGKLG